MAPPAKKQKGPSAYMIFAEEQRPATVAKLRAESSDGKVPVTAVAKAIGELWKSLSQTEQQSYRDKAQQRAVELAAAAEETAAAQEDIQQDTEAGAPAATPAPAALPRHVVKKIMLADDEIQRVSADAQWLVAEAAALFLQQLAAKAATAAAAKKRKTIQLADFEHVVRCDKRLVEAGLKDIVQNKRFFELHGATHTSKAAGNNNNQQGGKGSAGQATAAKSRPKQLGTDGNKENQQQQQQGQEEGQAPHDDEQDNQDAAAEEEIVEVEGEQLTDEQRIELQEQKRKRAEAMAKARAAKVAERKITKEREAAKCFHKISTFFASSKPDTFV